MWKKKFRSMMSRFLLEKEGSALSMRSFAKSAGMSASAVSEIISGKRSLSPRAALQLLEVLKIDSKEKQYFSELIAKEQSGERRLLGKEAEILLSDPYFPAVLSLFELYERALTVREIAERFGLSEDRTREIVDQLVKTGMLERNNEDSLIHKGAYWTTTDHIPSEAIRTAHLNELKIASHAIKEIGTDERDFTSITFAGNSKQLARVQKEIRRFRDRVSQIMEEGDADQVYKLNVQLFPLDSFKADQSS